MYVMNKFFIAAGFVLALSACKKEAPVVVVPAPAPVIVEPAMAPPPVMAEIMVSAVNLGTAVGADQKVTSPSVSFGAKDVIYAAVDTKNASSNATLAAKWTYQDGQTVNEETSNIAPAGDITSNFKFSKATPWPVGKYKVEIMLNGVSAQSVDFEIK